MINIRFILALTTALCLMMSFSAQAQTAHIWIQEQNAVSRSDDGSIQFTPIASIYTTIAWERSDVGVFAWAQVLPGWAQAYAGITWAPKPWISMALGAGMEQAEMLMRIGGNVFMQHGRSTLLLLGEYGGSSEWYRVRYNRQVTERFGIGVLSQINEGAGPRVQFSYGPVTLWGAGLVHPDNGETLFLGLVTHF